MGHTTRVDRVTKHAIRTIAVIAFSASPALLLVSCDQFALTDVFQRIGTAAAQTPLSIAPSATAVEVTGTTTFAAIGGIKPYAYSVLTGGAGGSIDATTGVYKAPTTSGSDTIQATDVAGTKVTATVTIIGASTLSIAPSSLIIGAGNSYQFAASGGVTPYVFSRFTGTGTITADGLYTAPSGSSTTDTIRVTDAVNSTSSATISVQFGGALQINPTSVSVPEGSSTTFTAYGGTAPYTFVIQSGSGLIGTSSGTYTATVSAQAGAATVKLTDSGASPAVTATVDIVPAAPSGLTASLPTPNTHSKIVLSWTNNSSGATAIDIERKVGTVGSYSVLTTVSAATTTYTDTGLTPNTFYEYRLSATAASGTLVSPYSNEAYNVP